ncbi:MAG: FG-GAP repeat protein [Planctomycetes bacterium]|nr:FG-GAP repeat protein [Planctomycetota bacterium]
MVHPRSSAWPHVARGAALALAALALPASAQQLVKLEAPDAQPYDQLGWSVDALGSTVAVGSHLADGLGLYNIGAVYVYERGATVQKLLPIEAAQNDRFGLAVALGDGVLAVSSRHANGQPESGVVDLFRRGDERWKPWQRILPPQPQLLGHFGDALALAGDLLVVGAPNADEPLFNQGAAYVYRHVPSHGYVFEAVLVPDDAHAEQYCGVSVDTDGQRVVVGAHWDSATVLLGGAAYVFEADAAGAWHQTGKLASPDPQYYDDFGRAVSISGGHIAVGVPADDDAGNGSGSVYLFTDADGLWVLEQKLQPLDPQTDHAFGRVLDLEDQTLIVGAVDPVGPMPYAGTIYVFGHETGVWTQRAKLVSPALPGTTDFGSSLALSGSTIVSGGYLDGALGIDAGAAWVLRDPSR